MKFLFVIEDLSGKEMLRRLIPNIISSDNNSYTIRSYQGIGDIPTKTSMALAFAAAEKDFGQNLQMVKNNTLLDDLERLLSAYATAGHNQDSAVVVVCDLDNKNKDQFVQRLDTLVKSCTQHPQTVFCLAIEEGEAWLLGDVEAIKKAYPDCDDSVLQSYIQDSICGTWEKLADAIYPGGSSALSMKEYTIIGMVKADWAKNISSYMDVEKNKSPSFCYFRDTVRKMAE